MLVISKRFNSNKNNFKNGKQRNWKNIMKFFSPSFNKSISRTKSYRSKVQTQAQVRSPNFNIIIGKKLIVHIQYDILLITSTNPK